MTENIIQPEQEFGIPSDMEEELVVTYACGCEIIDIINVPICCIEHGKPVVCVARLIYFMWGDEGYFENH